MRFFVEISRGWPWTGLAFAVGLLLGDAVFVVRPTSGWFDASASSVWPRGPMVAACAAYLAFGTAGDWIAQAVWPAARRAFVPRMVIALRSAASA